MFIILLSNYTETALEVRDQRQISPKCNNF